MDLLDLQSTNPPHLPFLKTATHLIATRPVFLQFFNPFQGVCQANGVCACLPQFSGNGCVVIVAYNNEAILAICMIILFGGFLVALGVGFFLTKY